MELKVFFKSRFAGYAPGSLQPRPAVCLIKRLEFTQKQQDANRRKEMGNRPPFPLSTRTLMTGGGSRTWRGTRKLKEKRWITESKRRRLWLIKPPTLIRLLTWVSVCLDQTWVPQGAKTEQVGWKRMNINACLTPSLLTNGPRVCSGQTGLLTRQEICTPLMLIKILHVECVVDLVQGGTR